MNIMKPLPGKKHPPIYALALSLIFLSLTLGFLSLVTAVPTFAAEPSSPSESMIPSTIAIGSGIIGSGEAVTVSLDLVMPAPNAVDALTIHIEYDPNVLGFDNCDRNGPGFITVLCNQSDGDGQAPDVVSFTAIAIPGVTGSVNLGTITFTGSSIGTSNLVIIPETFSDGSGETPSTTDGAIQVQGPTAVTMGQMSAAAASNQQSSPLLFLLALAAGTLITLFVIIRRKHASLRSN